jgi:hypothetical protein
MVSPPGCQVADEELRNRILVDNSPRLYGFPP